MMVTPVRRRTRARELALQFLYAYEMRGEEAMDELDAFIDHHTKTGEGIANELPGKERVEVADYARDLVRGVHEHFNEVNRWIEYIARNWRLDRMAYLDRNILRIALYELLHQSEVPFKVVINEAIDIAKRFSTAQSGSFVNGILDRARVLIEDARVHAAGEVPLAPAAGSAGSGAAEPDAIRRLDDRPQALPAGAPIPRPARAGDSDPATSGGEAIASEDDVESPQIGEFPELGKPEYPAAPDLADPAALPRPRRRRSVRRRRPDSSDER
jgi:transcription antitermination protein NusB